MVTQPAEAAATATGAAGHVRLGAAKEGAAAACGDRGTWRGQARRDVSESTCGSRETAESEGGGRRPPTRAAALRNDVLHG